MKKTLLFIALSVLLMLDTQAQAPIQVAPIPLINDPGSLAASGTVAATYLATGIAQSAYNKSLSKFRKQWDNRGQYRLGTSVLWTGKMEPKLSAFETRIKDLEKRNEDLTIFLYSKKKKNTKLLADVRQEFDILDTEVRGNSSLNVILGEKINLYQNMMRTLTRLNRLLDVVEGNIDISLLRQKVVAPNKGNGTPIKT